MLQITSVILNYLILMRTIFFVCKNLFNINVTNTTGWKIIMESLAWLLQNTVVKIWLCILIHITSMGIV